MNLDEAVRVSAIHLDGFSSAHHGRDCVMCVAARAVLAMAPVVEAARVNMRAIQDLSVFAKRGGTSLALIVEEERSRDALWDALSTLSSKVTHGE